MANFIRIAKQIGKSPLPQDVLDMAKTFIHTDDTPIAQALAAAYKLSDTPIPKVHQLAIDMMANHPIQTASQLGNKLFTSSDAVLNFIDSNKRNMAKDLSPERLKHAKFVNSSSRGMLHLLNELGLGWSGA